MTSQNSPRHFCFICCEYPPAPHGGTGSSYRDLAEGLAACGHRVTVAGVYSLRQMDVGKGTDEQVNGVRVIRLPTSPNWLGYKAGALADRYQLKRLLAQINKKTPFDLIEASDYDGWTRFRLPKVPTVVRIRGSNLFFDAELNRPGNKFEHALERTALVHADFIASVSRYAANRTLQLCGLSDRPCTVIYNAVDTSVFSPSPMVKTEPGLIVYVNSLNPKKGIEQLLDAMNIVCPSHPEAKLVVIGADTQKPRNEHTYLETLKERIRPEFRERVIFTGRLKRDEGVLDHLRRANICCYPSHMETFGIAAIEAMAIGKPTIFSRTGPGPEVIEDGVSGLLCDPTDPKDIATKIQSLLKNNALAEQFGRNARKRVEQYFDKKDWLKRNLQFFESVARPVASAVP